MKEAILAKKEQENAHLRYRFCPKCGSAIEDKAVDAYPCPKCGSLRFSSDNFCGACGAAKCFLFVFRHPDLIGRIVFTDTEEKAWQAITRDRGFYTESSIKNEFNLVAKLEVPGLLEKGERR